MTLGSSRTSFTGSAGALLIINLVVAFLFVAPASAQVDACADLIDEVGVSDANGLRTAIQAAEDDIGIDLTVIALQSLGGSSSLEQAARQQCGEAFESAGDVADGKVILAVSVDDRLSAVDYGDDLNERLDDDASDIRGRMNAFFQSGEIGAGLASGVGGITSGYDSIPADYTTPIGTGVLGTAAVVGGGAWLYTKRRSRNARNQTASEAFAHSSLAVTDLQARWYDAEQQATLVGGRLTGASMARLDAAQIEAAGASRTLYEAWSPVSEVTADDVLGMDEEQQAEVAQHVGAAESSIGTTTSAVEVLEAVLAELDGAPDAMASMHRETIERLQAGLGAATARTNEGWVVTSGIERLTALGDRLDAIDPFAVRVDVDSIAPKLQPLATEVAEIATELEALEEHRNAAEVRRADAESEIGGQRGRVLQLRSAMNEWAKAHHDRSFAEIAGHADEAEKLLSQAESRLMTAQSYGEIPRDLAVLDAVLSQLDASQTAVDLADELLDEGDELDVLLAAALENSARAVAHSADDARSLANFVGEHRRDVPSRAPQIVQQVQHLQGQAEAALQLTPPDHLEAMELAGRIESIVNTELEEFQSTVDLRERERHQATSAIQSANVAIDRADRHVSAHVFSGRRDREAQQSIDTLRSDLLRASDRLDQDPKQAAADAERISVSADQIYREAQRRQRNHRGGGFGGGIVIGGGGFRGHGGGRSNRGGGWGGGGGGGFGGGFGGGSSGGWGGGGGGFSGGSSGGW